MSSEVTNGKEKPFSGIKVYYSGTIAGAPEIDLNFPRQLVEFMEEKGANVLSKHVAYADDREEMNRIKAEKMGISIQELKSMTREEYVKNAVRKQDLDWVDESTHVVALVNAPSHGVGMELQEAILKPRLGLNETPILCLIHKDLYNKLSGMVTGVSPEESPKFFIRTYENINDAQEIVFEFLTGLMKND